MKRCLSSLLLVFALAVPTFALAAPGTASAATYGAQVGGDFTLQARGQWSQAQVMSSLDALYAAGGRIGRADSDWAGAEPHAPVHGHHVYNWSYDDLMAGEMAQAHLRWEPTLEFTPRWAQVHRSNVLHLKSGIYHSPLPPANNANFAAYATAFLHRYGTHGSFWATHASLPYLPVNTVELWNEPDNTHDWGPIVDLQDYARMYEVVRSAVHRVNRGVRLVTGGLAWTYSSLPRLLKAFEHKPIDEVAVHPYGKSPVVTVATARFALAELRKFGRGSTPLLVNEYGWTSQPGTWGSTNPSHVNPYVYAALIGLSRLRISQILPFEWTDSSWGLSDGTFARAIAQVRHGRRH